MKNIINVTTNNTRQGKLTITSTEHVKKKSITKNTDSLIEDFGISLKTYQTELHEPKRYGGFEKIIHDVNSNNLSEYTTNKPSNLRRLKSWNKGLTKKLRELEDSLPSSDELKQTLRQVRNNTSNKNKTADKEWKGIGYNKEEQWRGVGYNVLDQWKGIGYTLPENSVLDKSATLPSRRKSISSELRNKIVKQPLRRFSTSAALRKISDPTGSAVKESEEPEFIDFGACYSPDEMKSWGLVLEKLTNTIRYTGNGTQKRYFSLSDTLGHLKEPAKKIISHSLPGSVKRRRKSYECQRKLQENDLTDAEADANSSQEDVRSENGSHDVSLNREVLDEILMSTSDTTFSPNVWYHGELDICYSCHVNSGTSVEEKNINVVGSILARVDKYGDVLYSITYNDDDVLCIGSFPIQFERYCLDFSNPEQPRFTSIKYLIAYMIEQKFLQRVTFAWLIDNCDQLF